MGFIDLKLFVNDLKAFSSLQFIYKSNRDYNLAVLTMIKTKCLFVLTAPHFVLTHTDHSVAELTRDQKRFKLRREWRLI